MEEMGLAGRSKVAAFGWMKLWAGSTPAHEGVVRHAGTRRGWEPQGGLKVPTGKKASRRCGKCVGRGRQQA